MRLIDADKLKDYFYYGINDKPILGETDEFDRKVIDIIDNAPTVNAQPIVHAKWIKEKHKKYEMTSRTCSNCGMSEGGTTIKGNYCWYCGAKMDKEIEDVTN